MAETTKEALTALLRQVEASDGPDRQIDAALWAAIQGCELVEFDDSGTGEKLTTSGPLRFPSWCHPPGMTGSVDRALAVVERCGFSNCMVDASFSTVVVSEARIKTWEADSHGTVSAGPSYSAEHRKPAIAVVGALLKALIASAAATPPLDLSTAVEG